MEKPTDNPLLLGNLKIFVKQLMEEKDTRHEFFSDTCKINFWRDVIEGENPSFKKIEYVARCFGFPSLIEFLQEMKNRNLYS